MSLQEHLNNDLKAAMRAGDEVRRDTIRLLLASVKRVQVDQQHSLSDAEVAQVIQREIKQRRESIAEFSKAGRTDLVDREQAELAVLQVYQPAQLDRGAIQQVASRIIAETGATGPADMKKVMPVIMAELRGQADGREISDVVTALLRSSP